MKNIPTAYYHPRNKAPKHSTYLVESAVMEPPESGYSSGDLAIGLDWPLAQTVPTALAHVVARVVGAKFTSG